MCTTVTGHNKTDSYFPFSFRKPFLSLEKFIVAAYYLKSIHMMDLVAWQIWSLYWYKTSLSSKLYQCLHLFTSFLSLAIIALFMLPACFWRTSLDSTLLKLKSYAILFQVGFLDLYGDYVKHSAGNVLIYISSTLIKFVRFSYVSLFFFWCIQLCFLLTNYLLHGCCSFPRNLSGFSSLSLCGWLYMQHRNVFITLHLLQLTPTVMISLVQAQE